MSTTNEDYIRSLPPPVQPGEELERLRREIGELVRIAPYHWIEEQAPTALPVQANGNGYHHSKPKPMHYCYGCAELGIRGSRWQWDMQARNWVCSAFRRHDERRNRP